MIVILIWGIFWIIVGMLFAFSIYRGHKKPVFLEVYPEGDQWVAHAYRKTKANKYITYTTNWIKFSRGHNTKESALESGRAIACLLLSAIEAEKADKKRKREESITKDIGPGDC